MNSEQLAQASKCTPARAEAWLPYLISAMTRFSINTPNRMAAFIAQVSHESAHFTQIEEDLDYSAKALMDTFEEHFTASEAQRYARQPAKIANRVYANRMGNGDEASGDGWMYRGRGLIQITGKDNYKACGDGLWVNLLVKPELLLLKEYAALSAGWFWSVNKCNELADHGDFAGITRKINGGLNGQADRLALYESAESVFA